MKSSRHRGGSKETNGKNSVRPGVEGLQVAREERARKLVEEERVILNRFLPSGREIWTVMGNKIEYLVDATDGDTKIYCSCDDFYFRVLSSKVSECYHLAAVKRARKEERYAVVERKDEELQGFLSGLLGGLLLYIS